MSVLDFYFPFNPSEYSFLECIFLSFTQTLLIFHHHSRRFSCFQMDVTCFTLILVLYPQNDTHFSFLVWTFFFWFISKNVYILFSSRILEISFHIDYNCFVDGFALHHLFWMYTCMYIFAPISFSFIALYLQINLFVLITPSRLDIDALVLFKCWLTISGHWQYIEEKANARAHARTNKSATVVKKMKNIT